VRVPQEELIHLCVVSASNSLPQLLEKASESFSDSFHLAAQKTTEEISWFTLSRRFGRRQQHFVEGSFCVLKSDYEGVWLLVTIASNDFWKDGLKRLIETLYPRLVRPFFTQRELQRFATNIEDEFAPLETRIVRTNSKGRIRTPLARRSFTSALSWTDTDLRTAFARANEDGSWFRSIALEFLKTNRDAVATVGPKATISKYGYVSCTGRAAAFITSIIVPMCKSAYDRRSFLSKRDKRATEILEAKPLKIKYEFDIFSSAEQIRKLLNALKHLDHANCSVLHANPYLHVALVDNYDYSAVDVWVLDRREILLIPQIKTSEASLKRTINYIFETFREGSLVEAGIEAEAE
jgi:hypothetical protein